MALLTVAMSVSMCRSSRECKCLQ